MNEALNTVITGFVTYFVTNLAKKFDFLQSQENTKLAIRVFVGVISVASSTVVVFATTPDIQLNSQTFVTTLLNAIGAYYFANGKYHTKQDPSTGGEIEYLETEVKSE